MSDDERIELVVRTASKLTQEDRELVAERILEETPIRKTEERFSQLLGIAEEVTGHTMRKTRDRQDVAIRRIVAYRMKEEGFRVSDIARTMGYNHSTILHYFSQMRDCFELPVYYHNDIELYTRFIETITPKN